MNIIGKMLPLTNEGGEMLPVTIILKDYRSKSTMRRIIKRLRYDAAKTIFGSVYDAYDETVYIDSRSYTVSGVLSQMGTVASGISRILLFMYNTGIKYLTGSSVSPTVTVIAENVDNVASIKTDIRREVLAESYLCHIFTDRCRLEMEAASKIK